MGAYREMPADFPLNARRSVRELKALYTVSDALIKRWRRELGITVPPGAPKHNGNAIGNLSKKKETHGMDGIDAVRICLSCTAPRCKGSCARVR